MVYTNIAMIRIDAILTKEIMYDVLVRKDITFEGSFYAGVKTTGIFCRPTCPAKKPKQENVEFFNSTKEAILHGYRPCKVCSPLENLNDTPSYIKEIISRLTDNPFIKLKDSDFKKIGFEPNRIRRWFKQHHGLTFHGYQRMLRLNSAFKKLTQGEKITTVAFDSGYESLSGFSDAYKSLFGNSPSNHKTTQTINITRLSTPLGPMFACAVNNGICLLEFADRRLIEFEFQEITRLLKAKIVYGNNIHFDNLRQQLGEYFDGKRTRFDLPLVTPGSAFQKQVWNQLIEIPYGTTLTYKQQAIILTRPSAVRAVAKANGYNRIAIIIPCHRVIGTNGNLTGYGGGLWRKKWLLEFEAQL